ncbi:conjugal transfer protein TraM [Yersinia massiliensis]|uniref:Conjugal transfer protein TraM n=1 Tax=Yersinia massiliensis TaxID=419257 RepID=A0ABM6V1T4_9GAMM|nr:conjugal transfer protein TraM [Yersinia massiliensis]AVX40755.1 conjugal transfer protein TraM [Yersinia massiliensis]
MTDEIDELIKDIALKNGVAIDRDDPIMILQTMQLRFLAGNKKAQIEMLDEFKEELEGVASRWGLESKSLAEKILNNSLKASKETMAIQLQESVQATSRAVGSEIEIKLACLNEPVQWAKKIAIYNLIASLVTFLTACMIIVFFLFK